MAQARQDFRVHFGMPRNKKTRRMYRRLGAEGCWRLVCLWAYVGENHPSGWLGKIPDDELEEIVDWPGQDGAFSSALWDLKLICRGGARGVGIKDWDEHQPFLAARPARQKASRTANKAKRRKQLRQSSRTTESVTDSDTDSKKSDTESQTDSDTPIPSLSLPSQSHSISNSSPSHSGSGDQEDPSSDQGPGRDPSDPGELEQWMLSAEPNTKAQRNGSTLHTGRHYLNLLFKANRSLALTLPDEIAKGHPLPGQLLRQIDPEGFDGAKFSAWTQRSKVKSWDPYIRSTLAMAWKRSIEKIKGAS